MESFTSRLLGLAAIAAITIAAMPRHAGAALISFQEGVSPTGAYTNDAVYIRSGDDVPANADTNFNNDPDQEVIVGPTINDRLRGMFEFDVSAIPASNQIDSVSLVLTTLSTSPGINNVGGPGALTTFDVYGYGFDIVESVSTWNDPDGDGSNATGDTTAGGTLGTLLTSASFDVEVTGQTITFGDTPAFRSAVADALADDGFFRFFLRGDDETIGTHNFARFSDETVTTADFRPELLVTHSTLAGIVPEPSTVTLTVLGLLG